MKKIITLIISVATITMFSNQNLNAQTAMVEDKSVVSLGIGFGGYGNAYTTGATPTIMGKFEKGIIDDLGPGNLSVGGVIGIQKGDFDFVSSRTGYTYFTIGGRASYHPHFINSDKMDFYAGLGLGYYSVSAGTQTEFGSFGVTASSIAFNAHVGIRYDFNPQWGAWAELGSELSILSLGASYNF